MKFKDFIEKEATSKDRCKYYKDYPYQIQIMLKKVYICGFRFNLYKKQIIFMLNEALEPFAEDREDENLFNL